MNTANAAPGPLSSATERMVPDLPRPAAMPGDLDSSERVLALDKEIRGTPRALCAERAVLLTRYFREEAKWAEPMGDSCTMIVKKAAALSYILRNKRIRIYPRELLVGNFTSHRVGGGIFPELHGVAMMEDLFRFPHRPLNPLAVSREERWPNALGGVGILAQSGLFAVEQNVITADELIDDTNATVTTSTNICDDPGTCPLPTAEKGISPILRAERRGGACRREAFISRHRGEADRGHVGWTPIPVRERRGPARRYHHRAARVAPRVGVPQALRPSAVR